MPVLHAKPDIAQHGFERLHDGLAALRILDPRKVEMDKALAPRRATRRAAAEQSEQTAVAATLDGQDRVGDQLYLSALFAQLGQRRIEQEGHVVVDDFQYRDRRQTRGVSLHARIMDAHPRSAGTAFLKEVPGRFREIGQFARRVAHKIFVCGPPHQGVDEALRNIAAPTAQNEFDLGDEPAPGAGFVDAQDAFGNGNHDPPNAVRLEDVPVSAGISLISVTPSRGSMPQWALFRLTEQTGSLVVTIWRVQNACEAQP